MPTVKPFQFENLKRYTKKQVELSQALLSFLPQDLETSAFVRVVAQQLEKYTRQKVDIELTAVREPSFSQYLRSIPDPTLIFVLEAFPLTQSLFLQIDVGLAHVLVDCTLGGKGDIPVDLKSLTPIEEGVLKFIQLKILSLLSQYPLGLGEVQFRMARLATDRNEIEPLNDPEENLALLSIQVTVGKKAGFIRIALPNPLVDGLLQGLAPAQRPLTSKDFQRLQGLMDVKLPIWIELGRLDIKQQDFSQLQVGDVVLIDEVFAQIGETGVVGEVVLRVKEGVGGGIRGEVLASSPQTLEVRVDDFF